MTDLVSFMVPYSISSMDLGHALFDLEASINLMSLSIFKKFGIEETKPTTVVLQLQTFLLRVLRRNIEDVLVKVGKFIFSTAFILLYYEANQEEVKFNVVNALKFPDNVENYNVIESLRWGIIVRKKSLARCCPKEFDVKLLEGIMEEVKVVSDTRKLEPLDLQTKGNKKTKPSIEEPSEI
ncbi:uncharacterized protein E5676_scaffold333G00860 [Cucumis melo var. makuwa]|uniref:Uncharacterized protein n=1 Tax=Cucumis melo var. makuwa TaxID=1194695 RepID=A0A5D3DFH0_CUCMM|nr:uncharacterized protein E5676_scaffold333G00860 [Cucumis melo var. makuwa]